MKKILILLSLILLTCVTFSQVTTYNLTITPRLIVHPISDVLTTVGDSTIVQCLNADTYSWSTGETTADITVYPTTTTTYTVTGTLNGKTLTKDAVVVFSILPTDIDSCKLWLRADSIALGSVTTWTDLSGFNNDFTQSTAGNKPINTASEIGTHRGVVFDGTDDYLENTTIDNTLSMTMIVVWKADNQVTTNNVLWGGVDEYSPLIQQNTDDAVYVSPYTQATTDTSPFTAIYSIRYTSSTDCRMKRNGSTVFSGSINYGNYDNTGLYIGANKNLSATYFLDGTILEIIKYNRVLTDDEELILINSLNEYYNGIY